MAIVDLIKNAIPKDPRSNNIAKNVIVMFIIRGLGILVSFLLVPLTINYVNEGTYGIWLTLSSIVSWMSFFNIGLNSSLRNKFAEAKATNSYTKAQAYVSTTYIILTLIFGTILVLFFLINKLLDWNKILNVNEVDGLTLSISALIVVSYFCIKFVLSSIDQILMADQKPAISSGINLLENVLSLLIIYILTKTTQGSLLNLCIGLCVSPIAILIIANIFFFSTRYKSFAPRFEKFDRTIVKDLLSLGVKFFVISVAGIILYQTTNFIIIRWFSAENVTEYNIAYKYFSMLTMLFMIMITPLWSAVTEAQAKGEIDWIKTIVKKYSVFIVLFIVFGIVLLGISNWFYTIWVGKDIHIPFILSVVVLIYVLVSIFGSLFVHTLNGLGYVKIQFYTSLISPFVFIILTFLFVKILHLGFYSIVIASILANFNGFIVAPLQYYNVMYKHKSGIWVE